MQGKMKITVCTLFEGNYHFGVAALVNSLHASGFRGAIYAGYRGDLPQWGVGSEPEALGPWNRVYSLDVSDFIKLYFVPLDTNFHLSNYKPDFMLSLFDYLEGGVEAIYYFDPDICIATKWFFFEEWVTCGVALCEDVNSPLPENHPRRVGWRRFFNERGLNLKFRFPEHINSGLVGVPSDCIEMLRVWKKSLTKMTEVTGSLKASMLSNGKEYLSKGFANCFDGSDQDGLNVAVEASTLPISLVGGEAMGFKNGWSFVPHATGARKPWERNYLIEALKGIPPRKVDKEYWRCTLGPLRTYSPVWRLFKKLDLLLASVVGRFYRKT